MTIETTPVNIQDCLKDRDRHAGYLEAVLEDSDPTLIAAPIGDIAKALGVTDFARAAGLSGRQSTKAFGQEETQRQSQ